MLPRLLDHPSLEMQIDPDPSVHISSVWTGLIQVTIISCLDCCNWLLVRLPTSNSAPPDRYQFMIIHWLFCFKLDLVTPLLPLSSSFSLLLPSPHYSYTLKCVCLHVCYRSLHKYTNKMLTMINKALHSPWCLFPDPQLSLTPNALLSFSDNRTQ